MRKVLAYVAPALWPLILALNSFAQQPDFNSFERRVTVLEQRVDALAAAVDRLDPDARRAMASPRAPARSFPPGYADAFHRALAEGKPLVVWSGSAVCPACVHDTEGEFVNYVGSVPDYPADAVVVDVPEGGGMMRVGTITDWATGDVVRGHVPSIRRALRNWRERRAATTQASSGYAAQYQQGGPPVVSYGMMAAPMTVPMMAPSMMAPMAGGCASCGTAGRGLFGRR